MGRTLDPQAAEQLRVFDGFEVGAGTADLNGQRELYKSLLDKVSDGPTTFAGKITDSGIVTSTVAVPVRRYEPLDALPGVGLVYMHGGGWVFGDLDTGDRLAAALAHHLKATVISVDYRRAPEHAFPAAFYDCRAVAAAARIEFRTFCAVVGDSAGGNLAAAVALDGADNGMNFDAQVLLYPCLDASMAEDSYSRYAEGYGLTKSAMEFYWWAYAGSRERDDPRLSPSDAEDLGGFPPTVLATAGFDVLHDEGARFARRLIADGVPVAYLPFPSLPHGFVELTDRVAVARQAMTTVTRTLAAFVDHGVGGVK